VAAALGGAIRSIDPTVSVVRLVPFSTLVEAPLARPRFNALLLAFFAIASLFLAAVGQYAVIAAYVRQREREIAVRMALGATAGNLRRMVLAEAVALAGAGTAIGLVAAIGATRWMRGLLFELDALDPVSLAGAALLLFGVSVAACYWPIRRATRVDVLTALRA
jgi:ABC-type antimicrobial peptide transport system permease subunit